LIITFTLIVILFSLLIINHKTNDLVKQMDEYGIKYEKGTIKVLNFFKYKNKISEFKKEKEVENELLLKKCDEYKLECNFDKLDFFDANSKLVKIVKKEEDRLKSGKFVYLTFDDGPSKKTTPILDVLAKNNVPATFFITCKSDKETLRRIHREGHLIALHSCSHKYDEIYERKESYINDLEKLQKNIKKAVDVEPKYYRFPGGSNGYATTDTVREYTANTLQKRGYEYFDWNCSTGDSGYPRPNDEQLIKTATSCGNSKQIIILFHDGIANSTSPKALEGIIKYYKEKGYNFSVLNSNTKPIHFK
jgi:peptidoglycan/xylan/chitin deacetylase (PgdA/CDA1 family)